MFDPWNATFEEAIQESERLRSLKSDVRDPIFQLDAVNRINSQRQRVESGDGFAVLACIRACVTNDLIAPAWLAYEFNSRYDAVLNCRAKSWDDPRSFGKPYPKGTNIRALEKKRRLKFQIWNEVREMRSRDPDRAIDEHLFEEIGEKHGLGKTLASEFYYEAKKIMGR